MTTGKRIRFPDATARELGIILRLLDLDGRLSDFDISELIRWTGNPGTVVLINVRDEEERS